MTNSISKLAGEVAALRREVSKIRASLMAAEAAAFEKTSAEVAAFVEAAVAGTEARRPMPPTGVGPEVSLRAAFESANGRFWRAVALLNIEINRQEPR
jgi:hypothetical protein